MGRVGYVRVSSKTQKLDRQLEVMKEQSLVKLFCDTQPGDKDNQLGLHALLNFIREEDVVVVEELERLGRNNQELTETIEQIEQKGATLEVLNLPSLSGVQDANLRRLLQRLILEVYKYQAEQERVRIRERQAEGIAIAKAKGKYKDGQLKYQASDPRLLHAFELYQSGMTDKDVERMTGINRRTFQRYRQRYQIVRTTEI